MTSPPEDLAILRSWWAELAPHVPEQARALWFGIVDLVVDSVPVRHLYVAGCPEFDTDDDGDWACDYCWWPDGRYVRLPFLESLPNEPYGEILEASAALVRELRPAETLSTVEGVAVGFDDGDFEIVWARDLAS